jgi:hypothetical protein
MLHERCRDDVKFATSRERGRPNIPLPRRVRCRYHTNSTWGTKGGDIVESVREKPDHELNLVRGDFVRQAAGTTRAVRNVGTSPVEWVEFELK